MLARTLIPAALLASSPALAQTPEPIPQITAENIAPDADVSLISYQGPPPGYRAEVKIRNMSDYIEAVVDPRRGVYIQGYAGQWYYARVRGECPRLNRWSRLRFEPSPGGDFDRFSMIRADGWRCFVDSVIEVAGPPRRDS